jgi:putative sigma-54 modulation protein
MRSFTHCLQRTVCRALKMHGRHCVGHGSRGFTGQKTDRFWRIRNFRSSRAKTLLDFVPIPAHHTGMNLILSTHNVTLTKAIEDHIITRIEKLAHLDHFAINARVTLERDKTKAPERQFSCSMRLSVPGPDLFAEDRESDLYAAIDIVAKKVEQQIRKRHNKYRARKRKSARTKRTRQEAGL